MMSADGMVSLGTLGCIELQDAAGHAAHSVLAQTKRLATLITLAASPGQRCRRDTLIGLFWPDHDCGRARGALRQAVRFLRRELGDATVASVGNDELMLSPDEITCDTAHFERAFAERRFEDALDLYRGDFAPGMFVANAAPEFDTWLEAQRSRMRQTAIDAAVRLMDHSRDDGNVALAPQWARRAVTLAPDDECLRQALLELLVEVGDRAGALRAYQNFAAYLSRELGVEPSAATRRLAQAIRASTPAHAATFFHGLA